MVVVVDGEDVEVEDDVDVGLVVFVVVLIGIS